MSLWACLSILERNRSASADAISWSRLAMERDRCEDLQGLLFPTNNGISR